jgi:ABC-2 type transport system permease protein
MAVMKRALLDGRGLLIGLSIGVFLFAAMTMAFYPSFKDQGDVMMKAMPSFFRQMVAARAPWNSMEGFASWEYTHPLCIVLCVSWAVSISGRSIAGAIEQGTLGMVLSAPISRTRYFLSCAGTLFAGEAIVLLVTAVAFGAAFYALGTPPRGGVLGLGNAFLQGLLVYGAFGSITLAVSAWVSEAGRATLTGVGLIIASVFVNLFSAVVKPFRQIEAASLLYYYHPYEALRGIETPLWHYLVPFGVILAALLVGWRGFSRRDLAI